MWKELLELVRVITCTVKIKVFLHTLMELCAYIHICCIFIFVHNFHQKDQKQILSVIENQESFHDNNSRSFYPCVGKNLLSAYSFLDFGSENNIADCVSGTRQLGFGNNLQLQKRVVFFFSGQDSCFVFRSPGKQNQQECSILSTNAQNTSKIFQGNFKHKKSNISYKLIGLKKPPSRPLC